MPHSPLHKEKLKKNLIVLAMIFGWIALIWVITMLQIQANGVSMR
jgi:hypothetical protein